MSEDDTGWKDSLFVGLDTADGLWLVRDFESDWIQLSSAGTRLRDIA